MIKLMNLADQAQILKQGLAKNKRCRLIKMEMTKLKRQVAMLNSSKKLEAQKMQQEVVEESRSESYGISTDSDSSSSENKPLMSPLKRKSGKKRLMRKRLRGGGGGGRGDSSNDESDAKPMKVDESLDSSNLTLDAKVSSPFKSEPSTPVKSTSVINGDTATVSPSGVNRRTAVLFTRKAQAAASAFKKPDISSGLA